VYNINTQKMPLLSAGLFSANYLPRMITAVEMQAGYMVTRSNCDRRSVATYNFNNIFENIYSL